MNNYYIFLIYGIGNIGGMQLYVSRKIEYLKSKGWLPLVFYYRTDRARIPNLNEYDDNCITEMRYCVGNVSAKKRLEVLERVKRSIANPHQIIVETCSLSLGTWGEYIASQLRGKHILYVIDEAIAYPTRLMKAFMNFKVSQNLFYCINPKVIDKVWPNSTTLSNLVLTATGASGHNVIDIESNLIDHIPKNGNNILSLGRLNKPYVGYLFDSIAKFALLYPNYYFNFIVIGQSPDSKDSEYLFSKLKEIDNLKVFRLGYMWPLPKKLFNKLSIALGSAGSIILCSKQGIPSVSIDGKDYEAIGLVGINTIHSTFRDETDPKNTIIDYLIQVLINKEITRKEPEPELPFDYSEHQKLIDMEVEEKYFPTDTSIYFVSHPFLRSVMIKIDQSRLGHSIIKKLWESSWFNNFVEKINKANYTKR